MARPLGSVWRYAYKMALTQNCQQGPHATGAPTRGGAEDWLYPEAADDCADKAAVAVLAYQGMNGRWTIKWQLPRDDGKRGHKRQKFMPKGKYCRGARPVRGKMILSI